MKKIIEKFFESQKKSYPYETYFPISLNNTKFEVLFKEKDFETDFFFNIGIEIKNENKFKNINIFKDQFNEDILNKYINSYILKLYENNLLHNFVKIEHDMHRLFKYPSNSYFLTNRSVDSYLKINFKKPFNKKYHNADKFFELNQIDISCSSFFGVNEDKNYKPFFNLKLHFINQVFDFNIISNEFNQSNFDEFEAIINKKCLQQKYLTIKKSIIKDLDFEKYLNDYKKYDSLLVMNDY